MGEEGQRRRAHARGAGLGGHALQQRLMAAVDAVERTDGDAGGLLVIDLIQMSNADERLGHRLSGQSGRSFWFMVAGRIVSEATQRRQVLNYPSASL